MDKIKITLELTKSQLQNLIDGLEIASERIDPDYDEDEQEEYNERYARVRLEVIKQFNQKHHPECLY